MNDETRVITDVSLIVNLPLPAAIRLEMIGHRLNWHEAHRAENWDAANDHMIALTELQQLYSVKPVSIR